MRGKFMKYYVVAVFDEDSYKNFSYTQKNLSKRFRGNRNSPTPYIPLEAIENPNLEKLELVIEKLIKPYKLFKVRLTNEILPIDNNYQNQIIEEDASRTSTFKDDDSFIEKNKKKLGE